MENEQNQGVDKEIALQKKQSLKHRGEKEFLDKQSNDEITTLAVYEVRDSHLSDDNTETDINDAKLNPAFSDTQSNTVFIAGHPEEKGDYNDVLKVCGSADDAIHSQGKGGETPLHYAIADNNTEVTKMSLETDTFEKSINAQFSASLCSDDVNSLIYSASITGNIKYVKDLIKLGADVTTLKDPSGNSLLHIAAMNGNVEMALLLLEHDKDRVTLDSQNKDGFTPLNCAINCAMYHNSDNDYIGFAKLLLEHKANIALKDRYGKLPLHLAAKKIGNKDFVQLLINSEILHEKESDGLNALHIAAMFGNIEVVELLIKNNIDINAKCVRDKRTALMYAVHYGKEDVVKFLLSNTKIDINAQDSFCCTALHLACSLGENISIIKLLLAHPNIDCAIKNICGSTALSFALCNKKLHVNITDVISLFNKCDVFVSATNIEDARESLRSYERCCLIKPGDEEAVIQIKAFLDELQKQLGENEQKQGVDKEIALQKKQNTKVVVLIAVTSVLGIAVAEAITLVYVKNKSGKIVAAILIPLFVLLPIFFVLFLKHRGEKEFLDKQSNDEITALPVYEDLRDSHLSDGNTETDRNGTKLNPTFSDIQSNTVFIAGHPEEKGDSNDALKVCGSADDAIHSQGKRGETPLHLAAQEIRNKDFMQLLINSETLNKNESSGLNALHIAAKSGNIEVVELLIKNNIDINAKCVNEKRTALMYAVYYGKEDVVKFLLSNTEIAINAQDLHHDTALHIACSVGNNISIIKLLLTHPNIDFAIKNIHGCTALSCALCNKDLHANIKDVIILFNKCGVFASDTDSETVCTNLLKYTFPGFISPSSLAFINTEIFLDELQKQLGKYDSSSDVPAKISSPKVENVSDSLFDRHYK